MVDKHGKTHVKPFNLTPTVGEKRETIAKDKFII